MPTQNMPLLLEDFEDAPAFMAVFSGPAHTCVCVNHAFAQLTAQRDLLGTPIRTAFPGPVGESVSASLDQVFQRGETVVCKEQRMSLQATADTPRVERFIDFTYQAHRDAAGRVTAIFVHGVDVTDLVVVRQQSERQNLIFDTTLSHIRDAVYIFDEAGRFRYANQALADILGVCPAAIVGKTFAELPYSVELATRLQHQIDLVRETGKPLQDETLYQNQAGKMGMYEYIFTPVRDATGQITAVAGSTREITEHVQQAQHKDDLFGIVSHELKTPLTSMQFAIQFLQRRLAQEGQTKNQTYLTTIQAQITKVTMLINDLLDVTRISGGHLAFHVAPFAVDALVEEAIAEVQRTTTQHTIIREGTTQQVIRGDKERLEQALVNLLTNAIKYSPQATRVTVTVTATLEAIRLSVQDYGLGISPEQVPHLFDRFYRTTEAQGNSAGLGLGLYITAAIIRQHGGTIQVSSEPGHGSIFTITLPRDAHFSTDNAGIETTTAHD